MFVTYPQSGNGQRQVMSDHCRNMFLSFHLVVVSRDARARVSLSLSLKPSAREAKCCSFRWLLSFSRPPSSKERGRTRSAHGLGPCRCSTLLMRSYTLSDEGARLYAPNRGRPTGRPEDLESARLSRESRRGDRHPPLCFRAPT
jgi:hypothetical protein